MKKETFLKIAYICLSIMLIALTIGWVISGVDFVIEEVSAEEISNNALLNFNQLAFETYNTSLGGANIVSNNNGVIHIQGRVSWATNMGSLGNDIVIVPQHKYYIHCVKNDDNTRFAINYSGSVLYTYNNEMNYYITPSQNIKLGVFAYANYDYNVDLTYNVVDISAMFGVGNEPATIEEVKTYLPLNYYPYTTSQIVNLGYLDGYSNGYSDGAFSMQDGYTIEEVASDLVNTAYPIEIENNEFNKMDNMLAFNGTIGLNTKYTLIANDTIILDLEFLGDSTIDIIVQGNSGNYIKLTTIVANQLPESYTSGSGYTYYSGVITLKLPVDTNTILFKGIAVMQVYNVKYKTFNLSQAIVESFQNGVNSVDTQAIRDKAFEDGKNWAINHNTDTAWGSSWEFIGSAFSGVGDILSIELLPNIPLWTFIAIPLLFGLIALLYKLIGG